MFSGRWKLQADKDGAYFIAHSGPHAGVRLHIHLLPEHVKAALLEEANFYSLTALRDQLLECASGFLPAACCTLTRKGTHVVVSEMSDIWMLGLGARQFRKLQNIKWNFRLIKVDFPYSAEVGVASSELEPGAIGVSPHPFPLWGVFTGMCSLRTFIACLFV